MIIRFIWVSALCFFLATPALLAQTGTATVVGKVVSEAGDPVPYITIITDGGTKGVVTNSNGTYEMKGMNSGNHVLTISGVGYTTQKITITLATSQKLKLNVVLREDVLQLGEVVVEAESAAKEIQLTSFNVNPIETKRFANTTVDLNQVLNRTTGVRIREEGGLGSNFNFFLNGLSGRQVKFFVDGQPLENYGSLYDLNNVPVNLVERIDVYKGAVPVFLGADALGGAVNVVTNQNTPKFLDVSYSVGSFNTHRAAMTGRWRESKTGFTVALNSFYNYSDNNYTMRNIETIENNQFVSGDYKRFNDAYSSYLVGGEVGFTNKKWADALMIGFGYGQVDKQIQGASRGSKNQNGSFSIPVAGEAYVKENNMRLTWRFNKENFLKSGLHINHFSAYSTLNSLSVDSASRVYNWKGDILFNENTAGELASPKTIFKYDQRMYLQTSGLVYTINPRHQVSTNFTWSYLERNGNDILDTEGRDPFSKPNTLDKKVWGLAYQHTAFGEKLQTTASVKYFGLSILARETISYADGGFSIEDLKTDRNNVGYGLASRIMLSKFWLLKASYEYAYRIPESFEIFGDGLLVLANPALTPEVSNNINAGTQYTFILNQDNKIVTELSSFYRQVEDMIFPSQGGRFIQYTNQQNILINGLEAEVRYSYKDKFQMGANATYQNVLNNEKFIKGTNKIPNIVFGERMFNTPYFFANADVSYSITNISDDKLKVNLFHNTNYIHEFYLNYPTIARGGSKFTVPTQFLHHAGITISTKDDRYDFTVECRNLTDANAYDNFALQKPGRAFYIKLRCFIK